MIVCHCNRITDEDIRTAIQWMREADRETLITPGKLWRALGKRPDCGSCVPLMTKTMAKTVEFKIPLEPPQAAPAGRTDVRKDDTDERRSEGHRISQRGA